MSDKFKPHWAKPKGEKKKYMAPDFIGDKANDANRIGTCYYVCEVCDEPLKDSDECVVCEECLTRLYGERDA